MFKKIRLLIVVCLSRRGNTLLILALMLCADGTSSAYGEGKLLLHARMSDETEINNPAFAVQKVTGWEQGKAVRKTPGAELRFEEGKYGQATRFVTNDKNRASAVAVFAAENFAFSDPFDNGGRLEFWLKFNEDPHQFKGNKILLRTEPYPPVLMVEIYGSRPFLALEFYGNGNNSKTNYRFITYTEGWDRWYAWKQGEWHKVTLTWKRNKGADNAEMHLYIDDSQEGCPEKKCNDYFGKLPEPGSWQEVLLGNFGGRAPIDFSIGDVRSFGHP
jgi:hypothetical protein